MKVKLIEFKGKLDKGKLNEEIIYELFTLFDSEDIFETYEPEKFFKYYRLTDKDFQDNYFFPFLKKVLKNDHLRRVFLKEIEKRTMDRETISEFIILEIFLRSINDKEFKVLFNGVFENFFDILLKLDKKNGDFDLNFWMWEYRDHIGESLSPFLKKRIISSIKKQDIDELICLNHFSDFHLLDEQDAVSLIVEWDLIDFLIIEFAKMGRREERNKLIDYEFGLNYSKKFFNYTKDYITNRLRKYVKKRDYDEISALIHLHLLDFLNQEEIKPLFVDYDYTLFIHWKQGDDLARHIEYQEGNAVNALFSWANELESNAQMLERLVDLFKGKDLKVINAQVNHISLGGDNETLERATKEKLVSKDEIDIYYD